ncbi:MAG: amidohydrolase [Acidimicrobiaceae bacterium]|nr:amidohydrolase [Acidimicrobiaceae bacterium]
MDRYLCDVLVTMDGPAGAVPAPIAGGAVDVGDDGRIVWCGPAADAPGPAPDTAVHRTGILMPSLINAHCHTPMVLLRGAGEGLPVDRWLHEVMWPRESKLTGGDVRAGMRLGAAELLANGITTSVEMYFSGQAMAEGATDAGLRCLVTPGVIEDPGFTLTGPWPDQLDEMVALRDRWAGSDLVRAGIAAHAAYSVSQECLSAIAERASATGMPVHIHLAEQEWEDAAVRELSGGLGAPEYLESLGLLDGDVIAAHGVWLTPDDIDVLARNDTAVVHCPCSNAKHASGVAPVTEMRAAGLRVAIGTDGPASHHRLDLFEEMRTAIRTARIRSGDAQTLPPAEALRMTTAGAAEVLGWGDELGRLAPGCWADMVALSAAEPALNPVIAEEDDPLSRIVWSGSPGAIRGVWVAGRKVVEDSRVLTLDMAEAVADAQARARRLAR